MEIGSKTKKKQECQQALDTSVDSLKSDLFKLKKSFPSQRVCTAGSDSFREMLLIAFI